MTRPYAILITLMLAACLFAAAWWLPALGWIVLVICIPCALIDMGMNGSSDAEFAPFNIGAAAVAFAGLWLAGAL